MVSSRSFGNDHLIDRLAAGIAGAAGRISTDSLRSRPALPRVFPPPPKASQLTVPHTGEERITIAPRTRDST
jgi:hypothetical protein